MGSPLDRFKAKIQENQGLESRGVQSYDLNRAKSYASRVFQQLTLADQETIVNNDETFKKVMDQMFKIFSRTDTSGPDFGEEDAGFEGANTVQREGLQEEELHAENPLHFYQIHVPNVQLEITLHAAALNALNMGQQNEQ